MKKHKRYKPRVKIMCDYTATGIWLNGGLIEPKHLGLPDSVCKKLERYQDMWHAHRQMAKRTPTKAEYDKENKLGYEIFLEVKRILGNKYEYDFFREPGGIGGEGIYSSKHMKEFANFKNIQMNSFRKVVAKQRLSRYIARINLMIAGFVLILFLLAGVLLKIAFR